MGIIRSNWQKEESVTRQKKKETIKRASTASLHSFHSSADVPTQILILKKKKKKKIHRSFEYQWHSLHSSTRKCFYLRNEKKMKMCWSGINSPSPVSATAPPLLFRCTFVSHWNWSSNNTPTTLATDQRHIWPTQARNLKETNNPKQKSPLWRHLFSMSKRVRNKISPQMYVCIERTEMIPSYNVDPPPFFFCFRLHPARSSSPHTQTHPSV